MSRSKHESWVLVNKSVVYRFGSFNSIPRGINSIYIVIYYCTCMAACIAATLTSSQFMGVFGIQILSYCMRMYLSTTCIQDKYHFMIFQIFISVSISINMEHSKQLKSSISITITTVCLSYSSSYLKLFREAMKLKGNFSSFDLDIEARREIIQKGIQKQPIPYR